MSFILILQIYHTPNRSNSIFTSKVNLEEEAMQLGSIRHCPSGLGGYYALLVDTKVRSPKQQCFSMANSIQTVHKYTIYNAIQYKYKYKYNIMHY